MVGQVLPSGDASQTGATLGSSAARDGEQAFGLHRRELAHAADLSLVVLNLSGTAVQISVEQRRAFSLGAGH